MRKLAEKFRGLDIYGHRVTLHYKGEDSYKTYFGALCTIISSIIILFYFLTIVKATIEGTNKNHLTTDVFLDRIDIDPLYFEEQNFEVAFSAPMYLLSPDFLRI